MLFYLSALNAQSFWLRILGNGFDKPVQDALKNEQKKKH